jgi:hypothetical protein
MINLDYLCYRVYVNIFFCIFFLTKISVHKLKTEVPKIAYNSQITPNFHEGFNINFTPLDAPLNSVRTL